MHLIDFQMGFADDADDEVRKYAAQIAAIGDLLFRVDDCPPETVTNAGRIVRDLAERICDKLEVH